MEFYCFMLRLLSIGNASEYHTSFETPRFDTASHFDESQYWTQTRWNPHSPKRLFISPRSHNQSIKTPPIRISIETDFNSSSRPSESTSFGSPVYPLSTPCSRSDASPFAQSRVVAGYKVNPLSVSFPALPSSTPRELSEYTDVLPISMYTYAPIYSIYTQHNLIQQL